MFQEKNNCFFTQFFLDKLAVNAYTVENIKNFI